MGDYPTQRGWQVYWSNMCSDVSNFSSHLAYALQWSFGIEAAKPKEELRGDKRLDTLSSKLRKALLKVLRGQIVKEIYHEDARLKRTCGGQLNGRQIAWMMRKKCEVDEEEGHYYTSRGLMDLQLEKDNVPGCLIAWDTLSLEVDLPPNEKEICFSRQI